MSSLKKINYVVLVKLESKLPTHIPTRALCEPQGHWNDYIWIYLVPLPIEVLVEIPIVLWLWMIIQDTHGYSFFMSNFILVTFSRLL
jgi:hypothetical protein